MEQMNGVSKSESRAVVRKILGLIERRCKSIRFNSDEPLLKDLSDLQNHLKIADYELVSNRRQHNYEYRRN